MGYNTYYSGEITTTPPLKYEHAEFLFYWFSQSSLPVKKKYGGGGIWICPIPVQTEGCQEFCASCKHALQCSLQNKRPMNIDCKKVSEINSFAEIMITEKIGDSKIYKKNRIFIDIPECFSATPPLSICAVTSTNKEQPKGQPKGILESLNKDEVKKFVLCVGWQAGSSLQDASCDYDIKPGIDAVTKWLLFMIIKFFKPLGYTLNGEVRAEGEDRDDNHDIIIKDNKVSVLTLKLQVVGDTEEVKAYRENNTSKSLYRAYAGLGVGDPDTDETDPIPPITNEMITSILNRDPYLRNSFPYQPMSNAVPKTRTSKKRRKK